MIAGPHSAALAQGAQRLREQEHAAARVRIDPQSEIDASAGGVEDAVGRLIAHVAQTRADLEPSLWKQRRHVRAELADREARAGADVVEGLESSGVQRGSDD